MQKIQKIKLWEITSDQKLVEMTSNQIPLEERLEEWLESDISVLQPNLLVIGRQVPTPSGGIIDLLCLDRWGDTVVLELKRGKTPREVTAQVLDYTSWVNDLSKDELLAIANPYIKSKGLPSLEEAFSEEFETPLPDVLNDNHRSLIVAEEIDAITTRIVSYLADKGVPINAATVQHFTDSDGKKLLAQVYLIEPEEAEAKAQSKSRRTSRNTLAELEAMADENGIGEMYGKMRDGVQGILLARPYSKRVWYAKRLNDGKQRTVLIIPAVPDEEGSGLAFIAHASRFKNYLDVDLEELKSWLPENTRDENVTRWAGSSPDERLNALGLTGSFQNVEEVDKFLSGLRSKVREQAQE